MTIFTLIIGISLLILIHELGHFLAAKYFGLLVEEFGIGFPPRLFKKKIGETIYTINALPFGGFVKIHGERAELEDHKEVIDPKRSFINLAIWKRSVIIGAGVVMNFLLGWIVIAIIFAIGIPNAVVITDVVDGSPAAVAGIESGDRILDYETTSEFIAFIKNQKGEETAVSIQREGEIIAISIVPRVNPPEGQGALGIVLTDAGAEQLPIHKSIWQGLITSGKIVWAIVGAFGTLLVTIFTGGGGFDNFVGPVGIFGIADDAAQFGFLYLLQLIGLISLNLTVLNVIPVPALDGGRLLFLLIEKIKGSPISPKREMTANAIGFILLILLMVVITVHDVIGLF